MDPQAWPEMLMPLESLEHGARKLLSLGAEIEVLAPPELRKLLADKALEVYRKYADANAVRQSNG